jgi:hypothetical protein
MKRLVIVFVLVIIAGIAGVVVRSASKSNGTVAELRGLVSHDSSTDVRAEIHQTFDLSPGARVELSNLNGAVTIETSDSKIADVYIERIGTSQEALNRRRINVEADANGLHIRGEKGDGGFFARLFGSRASERVSLKLPRQISFYAKGVNGSVVVGDLDGSVDVRGVNGRVQIAGAVGTADFKGVNGNVVVALKRLNLEGVSLSGINGNIELQLSADVNAVLDAKGINGRVVSELPNVSIDKVKHSSYWARIGSGGNAINAKGINGNIRLTRGAMPPSATAESGTSKQQDSTSKEF